MKAIVVREFGGPEVMKLEEVPDPVPGPGQLLIRVGAVGVNPVEAYIRAGTYARKPTLPYIPGSDVGGTVEKIGPNVTAFKSGDRVYTQGASGGYAELLVCDEALAHPLPARVSFAQGAALMVGMHPIIRGAVRDTLSATHAPVLEAGSVDAACDALQRLGAQPTRLRVFIDSASTGAIEDSIRALRAAAGQAVRFGRRTLLDEPDVRIRAVQLWDMTDDGIDRARAARGGGRRERCEGEVGEGDGVPQPERAMTEEPHEVQRDPPAQSGLRVADGEHERRKDQPDRGVAKAAERPLG